VNATATTDTNGEYAFTDLLPGEYTVTETPPAGSVATTAETYMVTVESRQELVAEAGQAQIPVDDPRVEIVLPFPELVFGNSFLGSIHGYKFEDLNGNGLDDADPRLPDVQITLIGTDGMGRSVTAATTTDANGEYAFNDLMPGEYTVTETPPAGSVPTTAETYTVTVESRQELVAEAGQAQIPAGDPRVEVELMFPTLVFGNAFLGSIHGYKFEDINGNSTDEGDPRLTGVVIHLTGTDGMGNPVTDVTVTDANGEYAFTGLYPGEYTITETPPVDSLPTTPATYTVTVESRQELVAEAGQAGITDPTDPRLEVLQPYPTLVFGNAFLGELVGSVYVDKNNNGIREPNETGIPGVTVILQGTPFPPGNGTSVPSPIGQYNAQVATDANGQFAFRRLLPATYTLIEVHPTEFIDGKDRAGTLGGNAGNDVITNIPVLSGDVGINYWFGERGLKLPSKQDLITGGGLNPIDRPPGPGTIDVNPLPVNDPPDPADNGTPTVVPAATDDPAVAYDVNQDGSVTPTDVVRIVNRLNLGGAGGSSVEDVNKDGAVTTLDALTVINHLNDPQQAAAGEGEAPQPAAIAQPSQQPRSTVSISATMPAHSLPAPAPAAEPNDPIELLSWGAWADEDNPLDGLLDILADDVDRQWQAVR
jgi:protocatechuate 3,4-dioxygenase beta subunit